MADHVQPRDPLTAPVRAAQWTDARKFLVHLGAAVLAAVLAAASGGVSATEALQLAVLLCGTAVVYIVRNGLTGPWVYAKAIAAWVAVVAAAAVPFAVDGWRGLVAGAPAIAAAAAGALGVGVLPNTNTTTLADSVRDVLEQLHQVRADVAAAASPRIISSVSTSGSSWLTPGQVRGAHAPEAAAATADEGQPPVTAGARAASSALDTGTLAAVRQASGGSFL